MNYTAAYSEALQYAAPRWFGAAGVSHSTLSDWMQDNGDWRHHLFANPKPADTPDFVYAEGSSPHGDGAYSLYKFIHDGVHLRTRRADSPLPHDAVLSRKQYEQMRTDAATAGVHFPPHRV